MNQLKEISSGLYLLEKSGGMKVPGLVVASAALLASMDIARPLEQVRNVACLPGIVGYSIAMPDVHWGYGFPIGGVAATDAEDGVVSPGGVGYDINCGVRLALAPMKYSEIKPEAQEALLKSIFKHVPSGVGHGHKGRAHMAESDYRQMVEMGARWSVEQGMGLPEDLNHIESNGWIPGSDIKDVSQLAQMRGRNQLGSIGSGNHFVEVGEIETILMPEHATAWGISQGQVYILIHSGSRGFGHQVCQDALEKFMRQGHHKELPDRQLVAAPIASPEGTSYLSAMGAAANFAFNNRQQILHYVREAFKEVLHLSPAEVRLLYDVCHNIAKMETHKVAGKAMRLCVHRKGATRAFGPGVAELSPLFQKTGQPVLVPGDMGRASYLLAGTQDPLSGNSMTWCSCCHGAGRAKSRAQSMQTWRKKDPIAFMWEGGVHVLASSWRTIAEEMPDAYKDVDVVVLACQEAALANIVARLRPRLVIKG